MVFQFEHMTLDQIPGREKWDLAPLRLSELKRVLSKWQTQLYGTGWNSPEPVRRWVQKRNGAVIKHPEPNRNN